MAQTDTFIVKDSGERQTFDSGMVRDRQTGKVDWHRIFDGPMAERWVSHLTRGAVKYPDIAPGIPNWTLASGEGELARAKASAARHFAQWFKGERDEDHAAGVIFNMNLAEYVKSRLEVTAAPPSPTSMASALSTLKPHRSFLAIGALLLGIVLGAIVSSSVSQAADDWFEQYREQVQSSTLREMQLDRERDRLLHDRDRSVRPPC